MSDNGGSDLDVFKTLTKAPGGVRGQTLVGLAAPPPPPSSRTSLPPPPPAPSARPGALSQVAGSVPSHPLPAPRGETVVELIEDVDASVVEDELASEPLASAPLGSSPLGSAPLGSAPLGSSPLGSAPMAASALLDHHAFPAVPHETALPSFVESGDTDLFVLPDTKGEPLVRALPLPEPSSLAGLTPLPLPPPPSTIGLPLPPSNINLPPPAPPTNSSLPPASAPRPPAPSYAALSRPPTPPPPPPSSALTASGGDWDDEDDKTTVYTKEGGVPSLLMRAAPARTRKVPGAPPPPMSRPSAPVPLPMSATPTLQNHRFGDSPASVPPGPGTTRTPLLVGGLALVLLAGVLFFLLRPSTGGLVVTVAGPGNKPIERVEVLVDGKVVCTTSPCVQKELSAGTHIVKARADGYESTAETAVLISGQQDAVHNVRLAAATGTAVRISGAGKGLHLLVDGQPAGTLPQELTSLTPGAHQLRVEGEGYEAWEQTIQFVADEPQNLGPVALRVKVGSIRLSAGKNAQGAKWVLETGTEHRPINALPFTLENLDPSKSHTIVGTRKGFDPFRQTVTFSDGVAQKELELFLEEPAPVAPARGVAVRGAVAPVARAPEAAPKEVASGSGTLNINSIPAANVILDGRPLGATPKVGVSVPAGMHTVIFVKDGERLTKSVTVGSGQTQSVAHRFK